MFSIGERSVEQAGHGSSSIWRLKKKPWTMRATCYPVKYGCKASPEGKEEQPPHTIILGAGPVWRCITQLFSIVSPLCLQTRMQTS